jgi:hypothetical protein
VGIIRKTLSVSTLGIVPFRSKKELLRRAEKERRAAEAQLERETMARSMLDKRVAAAEKRVREAELTALHEAKAAAKARGKAAKGGRRGRRAARKERSARSVLTELVEAAQPVVQEQAKVAGRRARKAAERAQREAKKAAERAQHEAKLGGRKAKARFHDVERAMAPHLEAATERAQAVKDDLIERSAEAADRLKEKAEAART